MKIVGKSGMAMVSGELRRDPEVKYVGDSNSLLVKFGIRVSNEKIDGQWKSEYQDIDCWGSVAESAQHLKTDDVIFATGVETKREYNGKEYSTVRADFFTLMPKLGESDDGYDLP